MPANLSVVYYRSSLKEPFFVARNQVHVTIPEAMRAGRQERIAELTVPEKKAQANPLFLQAPVVLRDIEGHTVECCARTRTIMINHIVFTFSRIDYRLAERILQSRERKEPFVPFEDLQQCFDHPEDDLRRSLYRHMSKIRRHFLPFGLDIRNIREQGYALMAQFNAEPG